jgi:hypothetical protein
LKIIRKPTRFLGFMVCRCILKNNTSAGELNYIQSVSEGIVNILGVGSMDYTE